MLNDTNKSFLQNLSNDKKMILILGAGILLLLWNVVVALGLDIRPNAWLCYLDMHYWSAYFSIFLWIAAIWIATEFIDAVENYRLTARMVVVAGIILVILFALRNTLTSSDQGGNPLWVNAFVVVAICCAVRSLFLLYHCRYGEEESIDLEEATWFWVLSGFLWTILIIIGTMHTISIKVPNPEMESAYTTQSLFDSCRDGFWMLFQFGSGSFALIIFGLLIFLSAAALVCVAGKWALILLTRIRGD